MPEAPMLDVVAMGSPLVDCLAAVSEEGLERTGLVKGSMALVDFERAEELQGLAGPTTQVSGGSAANTAAGIAALGGTAAFVGKVADDPLGKVFAEDIRSVGVEYDPLVTEGQGTGRCLVLVTDDAERTMATHLGAAVSMSPDDLSEALVSRSRLLYLEGYLWDLDPAKEAMRRGAGIAHSGDGSVALSLSDPFCVQRHRREFLDLLLDEVDVLFGNEDEIKSLFGVASLDRALGAAEETGLVVVVTLGARGAVVVTEHGPVEVPAAHVPAVVDTTGAGDLFAAGFLFGLAHGGLPERCASLGALCAAEVISHLGARPKTDLGALAAEAGLLEGLQGLQGLR